MQDQRGAAEKKTADSAPPAFNLHIYLYLMAAILLLCIGSFIGCLALVDTGYPEEWQVAAAAIGPALVLMVVWLALSRCSVTEFSGFRGLLYMAAYMSSGVGTYAAVVAVPAVMLGIVGTVGIAGVSLIKSDPNFAPRQFIRLLQFYYRHRMYQ